MKRTRPRKPERKAPFLSSEEELEGIRNEIATSVEVLMAGGYTSTALLWVERLWGEPLGANPKELASALGRRDDLIQYLERAKGIRIRTSGDDQADATLLTLQALTRNRTSSEVERFDSVAELVSEVATVLEGIEANNRQSLLDLSRDSSVIVPRLVAANNQVLELVARKPQLMSGLSWREFEELLCEIFDKLGFETALGPGSSDGGIDLRLLRQTDIGPFLILVQAKRWRQRPLTIENVSALYGLVESERANKGILATTSRFLPSAERFAASQQNRLLLAGTDTIVRWIEKVRSGARLHL